MARVLRCSAPSVSAVVNALVSCGASEDCCMGLVPRGRGPHDTAASLRIPQNVSQALQIAATGECHPVDLGILNKKEVASKPPPQRCAQSQHGLPRIVP